MNAKLLLPFGMIAVGWLQFAAEESPSRGVVPEEFVRARPGKLNRTSAAPKYVRISGSAADRVNPKTSTLPVQQLGLTIWRLRPSNSADSGARILVHDETGSIEFTPERVSNGESLRVGDRVRLSIESAQNGRLYVVDQERYSDGNLGPSYLIFPTTRTRNGDNVMTPGKVIEIPAQDDRPNYFTMKRSRPDQTGEVLTVVVSPQPIDNITPGRDPLILPADQIAKWQSQWGRRIEQLELAGGSRKAWTKAEQEAGAGGTRLLTQDEPGPQTVYRVRSGDASQPLLVRVDLKYRSDKR